jgi:hypothetical protein
MPIDGNKPIPKRRGKPRLHPYAELQPGDSFFIAGRSVNVSEWHRRTGFKFTARKWCEDGVDGTRVWRLS